MIIVFNSGQCEPNTDGLNIYKDLIRPANSGDGLVNVEEGYIRKNFTSNGNKNHNPLYNLRLHSTVAPVFHGLRSSVLGQQKKFQ